MQKKMNANKHRIDDSLESTQTSKVVNKNPKSAFIKKAVLLREATSLANHIKRIQDASVKRAEQFTKSQAALYGWNIDNGREQLKKATKVRSSVTEQSSGDGRDVQCLKLTRKSQSVDIEKRLLNINPNIAAEQIPNENHRISKKTIRPINVAKLEKKVLNSVKDLQQTNEVSKKALGNNDSFFRESHESVDEVVSKKERPLSTQKLIDKSTKKKKLKKKIKRETEKPIEMTKHTSEEFNDSFKAKNLILMDISDHSGKITKKVSIDISNLSSEIVSKSYNTNKFSKQKSVIASQMSEPEKNSIGKDALTVRPRLKGKLQTTVTSKENSVKTSNLIDTRKENRSVVVNFTPKVATFSSNVINEDIRTKVVQNELNNAKLSTKFDGKIKDSKVNRIQRKIKQTKNFASAIKLNSEVFEVSTKNNENVQCTIPDENLKDTELSFSDVSKSSAILEWLDTIPKTEETHTEALESSSDASIIDLPALLEFKTDSESPECSLEAKECSEMQEAEEVQLLKETHLEEQIVGYLPQKSISEKDVGNPTKEEQENVTLESKKSLDPNVQSKTGTPTSANIRKLNNVVKSKQQRQKLVMQNNIPFASHLKTNETQRKSSTAAIHESEAVVESPGTAMKTKIRKIKKVRPEKPKPVKKKTKKRPQSRVPNPDTYLKHIRKLHREIKGKSGESSLSESIKDTIEEHEFEVNKNFNETLSEGSQSEIKAMDTKPNANPPRKKKKKLRKKFKKKLPEEPKEVVPELSVLDSPVPSGDGKKYVSKGKRFKEQFIRFARVGDARNLGNLITHLNSVMWLKQANIIDHRIITIHDAEVHFINCLKRQGSLTVLEYIAFLKSLTTEKGVSIAVAINRLIDCGPPAKRHTESKTEMRQSETAKRSLPLPLTKVALNIPSRRRSLSTIDSESLLFSQPPKTNESRHDTAANNSLSVRSRKSIEKLQKSDLLPSSKIVSLHLAKCFENIKQIQSKKSNIAASTNLKENKESPVKSPYITKLAGLNSKLKSPESSNSKDRKISIDSKLEAKSSKLNSYFQPKLPSQTNKVIADQSKLTPLKLSGHKAVLETGEINLSNTATNLQKTVTDPQQEPLPNNKGTVKRNNWNSFTNLSRVQMRRVQAALDLRYKKGRTSIEGIKSESSKTMIKKTENLMERLKIKNDSEVQDKISKESQTTDTKNSLLSKYNSFRRKVASRTTSLDKDEKTDLTMVKPPHNQIKQSSSTCFDVQSNKNIKSVSSDKDISNKEDLTFVHENTDTVASGELQPNYKDEISKSLMDPTYPEEKSSSAGSSQFSIEMHKTGSEEAQDTFVDESEAIQSKNETGELNNQNTELGLRGSKLLQEKRKYKRRLRKRISRLKDPQTLVQDVGLSTASNESS